MIILNEKEYVSDMLRKKEFGTSKIYLFLSIYARYLYQEEGLRKTGIVKKLHEFMDSNYPQYNPVDWSISIEKYASKAGQYPLCQCDGIWITEKELNTVDNLHNKVLERLAFTLLCLAKFGNFRNPQNHSWVTNSNGEIYTMACINTPAFQKDLKISQLKEAGLLEYARKVDNLNIRVLFVDDESEKKLFVSDFRKLGYEWLLYKGANYIRCTSCNVLTKNTNGKRRYCKECAQARKKELDRTRMQHIRNLSFCEKEESA